MQGRLISYEGFKTLKAARELEGDASVARAHADALRQLNQRQRLDNYTRRQLREAEQIAERTSETCIRVARSCREVANG